MSLAFSSSPSQTAVSQSSQAVPRGSCQNYCPFMGPQYNTAPSIWGTQKGTIILTTTHMSQGQLDHGSYERQAAQVSITARAETGPAEIPANKLAAQKGPLRWHKGRARAEPGRDVSSASP